ncbi:MAG: hypothetical protein ACOC5T_07320 [Elusimicrobiota bacterium]
MIEYLIYLLIFVTILSLVFYLDCRAELRRTKNELHERISNHASRDITEKHDLEQQIRLVARKQGYEIREGVRFYLEEIDKEK